MLGFTLDRDYSICKDYTKAVPGIILSGYFSTLLEAVSLPQHQKAKETFVILGSWFGACEQGTGWGSERRRVMCTSYYQAFLLCSARVRILISGISQKRNHLSSRTPLGWSLLYQFGTFQAEVLPVWDHLKMQRNPQSGQKLLRRWCFVSKEFPQRFFSFFFKLRLQRKIVHETNLFFSSSGLGYDCISCYF